MTLRARRVSLKTWMAGASLAGVLGVSALGYCDEPRANSASPEWAVGVLNQVRGTSSAARMQAVGILGTTNWQVDTAAEDALVRALRADPAENVRIEAASVLVESRYLTPRAHDALQNIQYGGSRDGFVGERSATVRAIATQALQRHPTSADPAMIARLQQENARDKAAVQAIETAANPVVATTRQGGAEESSPPERATLGQPYVPPSAPCPCAAVKSAPVEPEPAQSKFRLPNLFSKRPFAKSEKSETIVETVKIVDRPAATPTTSTIPTTIPVANVAPVAPVAAPVVSQKPASPPVPTPAPASPSPTYTATTLPVSVPPTKVPPAPGATPIPTITDREPESKSSLPDISGAAPSNMSLKERRQELRGMGLQDPTLKVFQEQVGAPPPAQSESPGMFRRLFSSRPAPESRPSDGTIPVVNRP